MHKRYFAVWIFILLAIPMARSQSDDFQLWTRVSIKWDLSNTTRVYAEEELRFFENISRLDKNNTEIGISQEFSDRWEGTLFYRLINNRSLEGFYESDHRFAAQLTYTYALGDWQFWGTPRIQLTYDDFGRSANWQIPDTYLRTEFGLSKEFKQRGLEPHFDVEFWYPIERGHPVFFDEYRITAGMQYKVDKTRRWDFFYRYQSEFQVSNPDASHILGISYAFLIRK